jgi:hypothetical protein
MSRNTTRPTRRRWNLAVASVAVGASSVFGCGSGTAASTSKTYTYMLKSSVSYQGSTCAEMATGFGSGIAQDVENVLAERDTSIVTSGKRPKARPSGHEGAVREVFIGHVARLAEEVGIRRLRCNADEMVSVVDLQLQETARAQLARSVRRWNSSQPLSDYAEFRATLREYLIAYLAWTEKPTGQGALGAAVSSSRDDSDMDPR